MKDRRNVWIIGPVEVAKTWDVKPKGCYDPHPLSRRCCELPADGHMAHMVLHPNKTDVEIWLDKKARPKRIDGWPKVDSVKGNA